MGLFLMFFKTRHTHNYRIKQILYHEKIKSQIKFSFEVLSSVILFTGKATFQY